MVQIAPAFEAPVMVAESCRLWAPYKVVEPAAIVTPAAATLTMPFTAVMDPAVPSNKTSTGFDS
jgi:hypothetical protein